MNNKQDYRQLVDKLRWANKMCDRTNFGCQFKITLASAADAIETLVQENEVLKQTAHREWVSVEERLPDEMCIAGCFDKSAYECGKMIIGYVDEICGDFEAWDDDALLEKATHWMPLPELPEVEHETD